ERPAHVIEWDVRERDSARQGFSRRIEDAKGRAGERERLRRRRKRVVWIERALSEHKLPYGRRDGKQHAIAIFERLRADDGRDLAQLGVALKQVQHAPSRGRPRWVDGSVEVAADCITVEAEAGLPVDGRKLSLVRKARIERPQRPCDEQARLCHWL